MVGFVLQNVKPRWHLAALLILLENMYTSIEIQSVRHFTTYLSPFALHEPSPLKHVVDSRAKEGTVFRSGKKIALYLYSSHLTWRESGLSLGHFHGQHGRSKYTLVATEKLRSKVNDLGTSVSVCRWR